MVFLAIGAAVLVAAVAVGLAMAFKGGGNDGAANGVDGACVRKTYPPMGRQHIDTLSKGFEYNSFPPSSGPHYPPGPKAPAVWNIYDTPIDQVALVHNLEHGGIVVQYGPKVPKSAIDEIAAWYSESPNGLLVAPLPPVSEMHAKAPPGYEGKIFLTAWTHVAACSAFDENAFTNFRDDYRGEGPERFPVSALQPGGQ